MSDVTETTQGTGTINAVSVPLQGPDRPLFVHIDMDGQPGYRYFLEPQQDGPHWQFRLIGEHVAESGTFPIEPFPLDCVSPATNQPVNYGTVTVTYTDRSSGQNSSKSTTLVFV